MKAAKVDGSMVSTWVGARGGCQDDAKAERAESDRQEVARAKRLKESPHKKAH